jgi:SAM-dependent methyltransferase
VAREFDDLIREADAIPVSGWDFSRFGDRLSTAPLPWDFAEIVARHARRSPDLLDLGTGGGEWLAGLAYRPPRTVATESREPNVRVARGRLEALGVEVVEVDGAPDNVDQSVNERRGALPFASETFHVVASRHESFVAAEIARVLAPDGRFLTQQIGGDYSDFYDALGLPTPTVSTSWDLGLALRQVETAGLEVIASGEAKELTTFADVAAFAWYLRAIPWIVDGFSSKRHRRELERLHERMGARGPLTVAQPAFWLEAVKAR